MGIRRPANKPLKRSFDVIAIGPDRVHSEVLSQTGGGKS